MALIHSAITKCLPPSSAGLTSTSPRQRQHQRQRQRQQSNAGKCDGSVLRANRKTAARRSARKGGRVNGLLTSSQTASADRSPAIEKDREINSIDETICVDVRESRLSRTPIADER